MTTTERPHRPYSFFRSGPRSSLLQFRVLLIVVVAALDNADKQLLASSFPLLEKTLHMNVATLGYFSLVTNASYALALPFWAWLLHKFTLRHIHTLLAVACATWGIATLGIAASAASFAWQASCRALTGAALASILPLSQTLLVECIPNPSERGQAFGLLSLCETFAGTLASASVVYWDTSWQYPYVVLGVLSLFMSILVHQHLPMEHTSTFGATNASFLQTARRVIQNPSFACLVGQGVAGGVPWGSMSFLLLLWGWKGFTNSQVAALQLYAGASATLGGAIGGLLGDSLSARPRGRIWVALASVLGGIPLYGCFLYSYEYIWSCVFVTAFHLVATWTTAGANRPLCADLAQNGTERAQVIASWILLEKLSAALFGAPLVGYWTQRGFQVGLENEKKARALAANLFYLATLFWGICALFWLVMAYYTRPMKKRDSRIFHTLV